MTWVTTGGVFRFLGYVAQYLIRRRPEHLIRRMAFREFDDRYILKQHARD